MPEQIGIFCSDSSVVIDLEVIGGAVSGFDGVALIYTA